MNAPCVETHKVTMHRLNIVFAFFAAILGMAASASFSTKQGVMMNVPFMIQPSYSWTGTKKPVLLVKSYIGLSGITTTMYPAASFPPAPSWSRYTWIYGDVYNNVKCGTSNYKGVGHSGLPLDKDPGSLGCDALSQCKTVGRVSMAFVCMGFLMAILSAICSKSRLNGDGWTKKLASMLFSFAALLCSLIAFLAFGACLRWVSFSYSPQQDQDPPSTCSGSCGKNGNANFIYPGAGGAMSLTSVFFFVVVFALNAAIPASDEARDAAKGAGLNKV